MIKIKLTRTGSTNHPFYRIVAIEEGAKKNSNNREILGHWEPRKNIKSIKKDRIKFWFAHGAQASPTVRKLIEN